MNTMMPFLLKNFYGTLRDLGQLEYASHGNDQDTRPLKESRKERRAAERKSKKKGKAVKLQTPEG